MLLAGINQALYLVGGEAQRVAHRQARRCVILEIGDFLALGVELLGRVKGDVGLAVIKQLLDIVAIDVTALALLVRPEITALAHTFVNADAQPFQGFVDIVLSARHKAGRVGVLDAENHVAAMLAGKQVVIQRGTRATNVQRTRG